LLGHRGCDCTGGKSYAQMMHKAAPFTASCNGLIDLDDETDEVADPAGTVFSGVHPSHLIVEVRSKVPANVPLAGGDDDKEEEEEEESEPDNGADPADDGVKKTSTTTCVVLAAALVLVVPLIRSAQ
jgi:hypothetical protein